MLVRLLCDLGRYDEALREADNALGRGIESLGLKVERARCLVKMRYLEEASQAVDLLNQEDPLDAHVQAVTGEFRRLEREKRTVVPGRAGAQVPPTPATRSFEILAETFHEEISKFAALGPVGFFDLDSGKKKAWGDDAVVDAAEEVFQETALACLDLDEGFVSEMVIEMSSASVMIVQKARLVAVVTFGSDVNHGKLHHRMNFVMEQLVS